MSELENITAALELKYKKQRKRLFIVFGAILLILLISGGFTGNHYRKAYKAEIKKQVQKNDSIIQSSVKKQDSLIQLAQVQIDYTDQLRQENDQLYRRNDNLYNELRRRNEKVFIIDNDFMSNARRISDGVDRFYKSRDTLR